MAPNFQSSFIPKEPITTNQVFQKKKIGILGSFAISIFIASIIFSIAVYVYKGMLKKDIENLESEMAIAEEGIDKETIGEMFRFSKKLEIAKSVVNRHQVISNFLIALSSSTVSTIDFNNLSYGQMDKNGLTVTLSGEATSYASIALQEEMFAKTQYFKSVKISGLTLSSKGMVTFNASISVDPKIGTYTP